MIDTYRHPPLPCSPLISLHRAAKEKAIATAARMRAEDTRKAWRALRKLLYKPACDFGTFLQRAKCSQTSAVRLKAPVFAAKLEALDRSISKFDSAGMALAAAQVGPGGGQRDVARSIGALVDMEAVHVELVRRFGGRRRALNGGVASIIDKVKRKILRSGGDGGVVALARAFRAMDGGMAGEAGDGVLTGAELKVGFCMRKAWGGLGWGRVGSELAWCSGVERTVVGYPAVGGMWKWLLMSSCRSPPPQFGLGEFGVDLTITELDQLISFFDRNDDGLITIAELMSALRGNITAQREQMISAAFEALDADGSGELSVREMRARYNSEAEPDVQRGRISKEQALQNLIDQWGETERRGFVSKAEFEDFYKDLSASVEGDDIFEDILRRCWRLV